MSFFLMPLQSAQAAARLLQMLDSLFVRPLLNARHAEEALGVSTPTAQGYINRLEDSGILREITGRARDRIYQADEVLEVIEAPLVLGEDR